MICKILTKYAALLEECLSRFHNRPEGLATVGQIVNRTEEIKGITKTKRIIVKAMLDSGMDMAQISSLTGLAEDEILKL